MTQGEPSYLEVFLAPLLPALARQDVTDIYINRPGEVWVETLGGELTSMTADGLTEDDLWRLARQIASLAHQGVSREHPLLSARLPDGARVQIIAPPATRGGLVMAIRKHVVTSLSLDDYAASGAFATAPAGPSAAFTPRGPLSRSDLDGEALAQRLKQAVRDRANIVIAGGTSTGKTTFLNALIREIPVGERLVLIEDTPELEMAHDNAVGLVAVKGDQGEARVTVDDLLQASLRMRPDRIIMGELRGAEAYAFLRAVNTGHPGSITTLHADSPQGAVEQLAMMVLQSGARLQRQDILAYAENTIDVYVQLERRDGRRRVREVLIRADAPS